MLMECPNWVNLRHRRFVRASPLVPILPPRHMRFRAAVARKVQTYDQSMGARSDRLVSEQLYSSLAAVRKSRLPLTLAYEWRRRPRMGRRLGCSGTVAAQVYGPNVEDA